MRIIATIALASLVAYSLTSNVTARPRPTPTPTATPTATPAPTPTDLRLISSTLVVTANLFGQGIGKTVLRRAPGFTGIMIAVSAPNVTLSGFTLDCQGAGDGIVLDGNGDGVDTVEVQDSPHISIGVRGANCVINNCNLHAANYSGAPVGLWRDAGFIDSTTLLTVTNSTFTHVGVYANGGQLVFKNNTVTQTPNHCGGQTDIGNAYYTNTVAYVTGNTIFNGGDICTGGMEFGGGTFTVQNNTVYGHGGSGIGLGHNCIAATVTGNTIYDNGYNTGDTNVPQDRGGIYIMYGAQNVTVTGNKCYDDQVQKTQTYGVILTPVPAVPDPRWLAVDSNHITITHNDLRGNLNGAVLNLSKGSDVTVSGNQE